MQRSSRTGWALAAACAVLLGASGDALATAGVVFVHGTGDPSPSSAVGYWTQKSIDTRRTGRPYLVVGYPRASCAGYSQCNWGPIVDQVVPWATANGISSYTAGGWGVA